MADNLQTKTEKLIKYGNEKFGLNETTLRGILDNASGSEDLTTELDAQDELLASLESQIDKLPDGEPEVKSVTYGVKIDLANSNPETSVEYTDDAVGFDKSYMDFANDTFVYGSWQDKFPFNQVKPCLFKNGAVVKYLNPNDYEQDIDGNTADITGADGDVMIEIPKVYYRLHKDENYQYIQISNTAQEGFCCLAHTYKGVEKDKVYIGAYGSYYDGTSTRSISGVNDTTAASPNRWRTYSQNNGIGYEQFYWDLLILLQCLYTIQFKNLNSQEALGYGYYSGTSGVFEATGETNKKGLYYGTISAGHMKFMGIEDFYGNRYLIVDGIQIADSTKIWTIDNTSVEANYNDTLTGYLNSGVDVLSSNGYIKSIIGDNTLGFIANENDGSSSTYYCDTGGRPQTSPTMMTFGGGGDGTFKGIFTGQFNTLPKYSNKIVGARLTYCG